MIKKIIILAVMFIALFQFSYSAYMNNENYTDTYLENNGNCPNLEIVFKVWNITDYENRKHIQDELCVPGCVDRPCTPEDGENCTRCKNDCTEFNFVKDAEVKIYSGPLKSTGVMYTTKTNATGEFKYKFTEPNQHLIEVFPTGNYNDYHDILEIYGCTFAQNTTIKEVNEEEVVKPLQDVSFNYLDSLVILSIKNTVINSSSEVNVKEDVQNSAPPLDDLYKLIEITTTQTNFSNMNLNIRLDNKNYSKLNAYKYDDVNNKWDPVSYRKEGNSVVISNIGLGLYGISAKEVVKTPIVNTSIINTTSNTDNLAIEDINDNTDNNTSDDSSNLMLYLGLGIVGVLVLVIIGFLVLKHMAHKKMYSGENKEVLTTYNDIFEQTKNYVRQYKTNYTKDQIYRALQNAKIPNDIIDKVFSEEY